MSKIKILVFGVLALSGVQVAAQLNPDVGIRDKKNKTVAFTNASIYVSSNVHYEKATLLIQGEEVIDCGEGVIVPDGSEVIDCSGKTIYPSFIELWSNYGLEEVDDKLENDGAYYWNSGIQVSFMASESFKISSKNADKLRKFGLGTVLTHRHRGYLRGSATLVTLAESSNGEVILNETAAVFGSLKRLVTNERYPTSLTGTIALIRQFIYDANWYKEASDNTERNISLEMFNNIKTKPFFFETDNKSDIFRLEKIAKEFGLSFHYIGNGDEFERIHKIKDVNSTLVIPVNYPKAYDLKDPYDADRVSLQDLMRWDMAPSNLSRLQSNGVSFTISTRSAKSPGVFFSNLAKAMQHGIDHSSVLYALTEAPAKIMKAESKIGSLNNGKLANLIITQGELGDKGFAILENWVQGERYVISEKADLVEISGRYELDVDYASLVNKTLSIQKRGSRYKGKLIVNDSTEIKAKVDFDGSFVSISLNVEPANGVITISAKVDDSGNFEGIMDLPDGSRKPITARLTKKSNNKKNRPESKLASTPLRYPNMAYGWKEGELEAREGKSYVIRNATVWTNEKEGILDSADVITADGKIKAIGKNLKCKDCIEINGTGLHLTSGIIDEHSHIAMTRGVNESGQSSSAEVRMSDVVNSEDINIYRQLAGGVTISQLLHGSANPIGGQSALIKLRWGRSEDELLYKDAPGFIKFALGENVKQANWGDNYRSRYPQTRMGVEQFFYEMFNRAKEYGEMKASAKGPYRKDLELEALLEVLNEKRFITCHSYRQYEINMLMHVADSFGFKVNTFTHILEGYKVADKMKAHGAFASTFSDWWAYKIEVHDAIPYNAALLTKMGVITCINSDNAEMARRLNQEAAKAVKYGGLSEVEAWKLCTLNPAIMLHIDDKVGSIKEGKDADLVLWSDNPLSIYANVRFTMIDGIIYYDEERNKEIMDFDKSERLRLMQKMMKAVHDGEEAVPIAQKQFFLYDCESIGSDDYEWIEILD